MGRPPTIGIDMKRSRLFAAALGAALLALVGLGPAQATGWTYYTPGPPATYSLTFSAPASITFATNTCSGAASSGTTVTGMPVIDLVSFNAMTFTGCVGIGGPSTITMTGAWKLHGTSAATPAMTDNITVHVDNIVATVRHAVNPLICSYTVTGKADGTFGEVPQALALTENGLGGDLTVSNVTGCLGQVTNGQAAPFTGTYVTSGLYFG